MKETKCYMKYWECPQQSLQCKQQFMSDASGDGFIDACNAQLNILFQFVHDHHSYLVCPDLLVAVGEILTGYGWGSSDPHSLHYSFYLFRYIC